MRTLRQRLRLRDLRPGTRIGRTVLTEDWAGLETKKEKEMFCMRPSMRP